MLRRMRPFFWSPFVKFIFVSWLLHDKRWESVSWWFISFRFELMIIIMMSFIWKYSLELLNSRTTSLYYTRPRVYLGKCFCLTNMWSYKLVLVSPIDFSAWYDNNDLYELFNYNYYFCPPSTLCDDVKSSISKCHGWVFFFCQIRINFVGFSLYILISLVLI